MLCIDQVLYVDCGYDSMLGYIPRELAQYLSPLIDKFHLNFEVNELYRWSTYFEFWNNFHLVIGKLIACTLQGTKGALLLLGVILIRISFWETSLITV